MYREILVSQDAHKTQTYNFCTRKHSHFPYTSSFSSTPHNTKQKTHSPSHPLHKYTTYFNTPRLKNASINSDRYTTNIPTDPPHSHYDRLKTNMRHTHTSTVSMHLATRGIAKYCVTPPPHISSSQEKLPRLTQRTLCPSHNK